MRLWKQDQKNTKNPWRRKLINTRRYLLRPMDSWPEHDKHCLFFMLGLASLFHPCPGWGAGGGIQGQPSRCQGSVGLRELKHKRGLGHCFCLKKNSLLQMYFKCTSNSSNSCTDKIGLWYTSSRESFRKWRVRTTSYFSFGICRAS